MMTSVRTVLLTGVALSLIAMPALAGSPRPVLMAQAGAASDAAAGEAAATVTEDPVATAEKAGEDARARPPASGNSAALRSHQIQDPPEVRRGACRGGTADASGDRRRRQGRCGDCRTRRPPDRQGRRRGYRQP